MEFHTEREEALYITLKQVLQNHVTTHRLSYHHTLAACIPVLGYILYIMLETWEEAPGLIARTVDELHQRVHTRALRDMVNLFYFPDRSIVQMVRNNHWVVEKPYQPGPQQFRLEYGATRDRLEPCRERELGVPSPRPGDSILVELDDVDLGALEL